MWRLRMEEQALYIFHWFKKAEDSGDFPEFVHPIESGFPNYLALSFFFLKVLADKENNTFQKKNWLCSVTNN